ncbi:hypothetical protein ACFOY2_49995 [Nonomuraea purpurea]|uniref:META domain-containing protein n=1 Tax=Nonomuraea purpurea TaxID=1849276 RepID=A0ABV8GR39_9ACTN
MIRPAVTALAALAPSTANAAAAPSTAFRMSSYGDTLVSGNVVWHNRTVQIGARISAPSGCARVRYTFSGDGVLLPSNETRQACDGSKGHGFDKTINRVGGVQSVIAVLDMWRDKRWVPTKRIQCERTGCYSTSPVSG